MFYQVFKTRNFPNCSIMEASDSSVGPYASKSILKGRDVLHKGSHRRVGDGCDNTLKCIFIIYLCGRYLRVTILNLYN